jgi:hypothetical protein
LNKLASVHVHSSLLLPLRCNERRAREFHRPPLLAKVSARTASASKKGRFRALPSGRPERRSNPAERLGVVRLLCPEDKMARVWEAPIFAIATVYFTVDALFSAITGPITAWLSKKRLLERIRRWVTSLGPYQSFALFAVPLILLEPAKPLSAYFLATGHFLPGALVFIAAEVLKLSVVERLFQLNKKKLLSISLSHGVTDTGDE